MFEGLGLDDRLDVDCIKRDICWLSYIASDLEFIHSGSYYIGYTKTYSASWIMYILPGF